MPGIQTDPSLVPLFIHSFTAYNVEQLPCLPGLCLQGQWDPSTSAYILLGGQDRQTSNATMVGMSIGCHSII